MNESCKGIKVWHTISMAECITEKDFERYVQQFFDTHPNCQLIDIQYSMSAHPSSCNEYIYKPAFGALILYKENPITEKNF